MTESEIQVLGLPTTRELADSEGGPYVRLVVNVAPNQVVEVALFDGRAEGLTTTSPYFSTTRGARVGMTLLELQRLYPEGRLNVGAEEGFYLNYATERGASFHLDMAGVPDACFERRECPDPTARRSVMYLARGLGA